MDPDRALACPLLPWALGPTLRAQEGPATAPRCPRSLSGQECPSPVRCPRGNEAVGRRGDEGPFRSRV